MEDKQAGVSDEFIPEHGSWCWTEKDLFYARCADSCNAQTPRCASVSLILCG